VGAGLRDFGDEREPVAAVRPAAMQAVFVVIGVTTG